MLDPVSHNRVVAQLTDDLMDFLDTESMRTGLSRSAVIRQSLDTRRKAARQAAQIEAEIAANETGPY